MGKSADIPLKQAINLIEKSKNILVMPSSPLDGDSLGSTLALYLILRKLGKEVTAVSADPIPNIYQFLPTHNIIRDHFAGYNEVKVTIDGKSVDAKDVKTDVKNGKISVTINPKEGIIDEKAISFERGSAAYDLIIIVDAGDIEQLGKMYTDNVEMFYEVPTINIDHHVSNAHFGKINLVDITAASTTEVLMPLIEDLEKNHNISLIDEDIATLLLAGIITDTGSFQHANTTPKSFEIAARLLDMGARQQEIVKHVYKTKNLSQLKLWGRILSKIKFDVKHRLVWSTLTQEDLQKTGSNEDEAGGIIDDLLTNAPGAEVVVLLKEKKDSVLSGSIRTTTPRADANQIAQQFGGGGHVQAAGFKIKTDDFMTKSLEVIAEIKKAQAERLDLIEEHENDKEIEKQAEVTEKWREKMTKQIEKEEKIVIKNGGEEKLKKTSAKKKQVPLHGSEKKEEAEERSIPYKFEE